MRLQDAVQTVHYFRRRFFLNLKTLRVDIDDNVHTSDDRRHVVLTVGFKSDRYPHGVGARRLFTMLFATVLALVRASRSPALH